MEEVNADKRHTAKSRLTRITMSRRQHLRSGKTTPPGRSWRGEKKEKTRIVTQNVTDPDCGLFVKGSHERQFAYEAHTACDSHGFVLETVVTPGNVHDSVAFDEVYDKVTKTFPETETIVADSAYKTPIFARKYLMTEEFYPQRTSGRRR